MKSKRIGETEAQRDVAIPKRFRREGNAQRKNKVYLSGCHTTSQIFQINSKEGICGKHSKQIECTGSIDHKHNQDDNRQPNELDSDSASLKRDIEGNNFEFESENQVGGDVIASNYRDEKEEDEGYDTTQKLKQLIGVSIIQIQIIRTTIFVDIISSLRGLFPNSIMFSDRDVSHTCIFIGWVLGWCSFGMT
ncbi:hypothetical protein VNO77_08900 [Canavalia gladiata]|uniref:Uncharacterized protein n=1 Tax=Canavalia gladiata TaxID=3824 RepID=A0AAN9MFF8_CANGL